eukprot:2380516-Pleurochrysis_carterae.AAC.1
MVRAELERVELELRHRERAELMSLRAQLALVLRGSAVHNATAGDAAASVPASAPSPPGSPPHVPHSRRLELCA